MKNKKITVKQINDLVWGKKWQGEVDSTALYERLRDLLEAEEDLRTLTKQVQLVRKFFGNNV